MNIKEQHAQYLSKLDVGNGELELKAIQDFIDIANNEPLISKELFGMVGEIQGYINDLEHEHEIAASSGADDAYLADIQSMIAEARQARRAIINRQTLSKILIDALEGQSFRTRIYEIESRLKTTISNCTSPFYRFKVESGVQLNYLIEQNKISAEEKNKKITQ